MSDILDHILPLQVVSFQEKILNRYDENKRDFPWRDCEDGYKIFVSEVMLQQTQADRVVPKFLRFFETASSFEQLATLDRKTLLGLWSGLGFNSRAIRLQKAAQYICENHHGVVPKTREELLLLPGIGKYSSASILAFVYNITAPVVDTNIRRVLIRELGLPLDIKHADLEIIAFAVTPEDKANDRNNALMDYGSLVATAQATGIKSLSKQSKFQGSARQVRGNIIKRLVKHGATTVSTLKKEFPHEKFDDVVETLVKTEMVSRKGNTLSL